MKGAEGEGGRFLPEDEISDVIRGWGGAAAGRGGSRRGPTERMIVRYRGNTGMSSMK